MARFVHAQGRKLPSGNSSYGKSFAFDVDFSEIDKMLAELPKSMGKAVMLKSLKKAAKPVRAAIVAGAPRGNTGNLQKSIVISTKVKGKKVKANTGAIIFVGADQSTTPHAHLVEFGTAPRQHKNGKSVGQMPANPFFRKAWDATKDQALKVLTETIRTELYAAAKRLASRAEAGKIGKNIRKALLK